MDQFLLLFEVILHQVVYNECLLFFGALYFVPPVILVVQRYREPVHVLINVVIDSHVELLGRRRVPHIDEKLAVSDLQQVLEVRLFSQRLVHILEGLEAIFDDHLFVLLIEQVGQLFLC